MPEPITAIVIKGSEPVGTTPMPDGMVVTTDNHYANIRTKVVTPLVALLVRFGFMFFTSLAASLTGGAMAGQNIIVWHDFQELLYKAAVLAIITAAIDLVKNLGTIFTRLEQTHPLMTGNV